MTFPYSTLRRSTKGLPPFSKKRLAKETEHEAFTRRILEERQWCEAPALLIAYSPDATTEEFRQIQKALNGCRGRAQTVHHVLQSSLAGKDEDGNVLALCEWGCHRWTHDNIELAHAAGLLRHSWETA